MAVGENNLDAAIRGTGGPTVAIGMSEGTLVLDEEQARLAHDPTAPPPDRLSFAQFSSPSISHGFGKSFMTAMFPPGTFVPVVDYTMPKPVESQYDTTIVAAAYDGFADFPDRPENLISVANSLVGAAIVHTPAAFTGPANVPPQNIRTTTNSRGATTTTYLLPAKYLPLTMPLHYAGVPDDITAQIDAALRPMVDAGYSRNDNPATAPINVDPQRRTRSPPSWSRSVPHWSQVPASTSTPRCNRFETCFPRAADSVRARAPQSRRPPVCAPDQHGHSRHRDGAHEEGVQQDSGPDHEPAWTMALMLANSRPNIEAAKMRPAAVITPPVEPTVLRSAHGHVTVTASPRKQIVARTINPDLRFIRRRACGSPQS